MNKKLEARIARLEKVLRHKNEQVEGAAEAVYYTANQITQLCEELAAILKSTDDVPWEIDNALSMCEDVFPKVWFDRLNRINNDR